MKYNETFTRFLGICLFFCGNEIFMGLKRYCYFFKGKYGKIVDDGGADLCKQKL